MPILGNFGTLVAFCAEVSPYKGGINMAYFDNSFTRFLRRIFKLPISKHYPPPIRGDFSLSDPPIPEPEAPLAEILSQPRVNVDVQSDQPVQVEVHVRTQTGETHVTVDTSSTQTRKRPHSFTDQVFLCDGVSTSEEQRYHDYFESATVTALEPAVVDRLLGEIDTLIELEASDEMYAISPTAKQVGLYYGLLAFCKRENLFYGGNPPPTPFNYREYQLAIKGLRYIISRSTQQRVTN